MAAHHLFSAGSKVRISAEAETSATGEVPRDSPPKYCRHYEQKLAGCCEPNSSEERTYCTSSNTDSIHQDHCSTLGIPKLAHYRFGNKGMIP